MIRIGRIEVNLKSVDGITESQFKTRFEAHYWCFSDKDKRIKEDYKELKKHFTKKK